MKIDYELFFEDVKGWIYACNNNLSTHGVTPETWSWISRTLAELSEKHHNHPFAKAQCQMLWEWISESLNK